MEENYNYDMSSTKNNMAKTNFHKHLFLRFTYLVTKNVIWAGKSWKDCVCLSEK